MEEEKKNQEPKKLSYDELKANFDELMAQYQKLMGEYRQAVSSLNQIDYSQFLLGMMFRVMEHPNRYSEKFIQFVTNNIETAVMTYAQQLDEAAEKAEKKEKK